MYSPDWLQIEAKKHQEKARGGSQETANKHPTESTRDPNTPAIVALQAIFLWRFWWFS